MGEKVRIPTEVKKKEILRKVYSGERFFQYELAEDIGKKYGGSCDQAQVCRIMQELGVYRQYKAGPYTTDIQEKLRKQCRCLIENCVVINENFMMMHVESGAALGIKRTLLEWDVFGCIVSIVSDIDTLWIYMDDSEYLIDRLLAFGVDFATI